MKLSIILPCYNEELSIKKLIRECLNIINDEIEIIIVDNGSNDNTFEILQKSNLPNNIIPVRVTKNKGYGNGILYGLDHSIGEVVAWTHADLQTDISDVLIGYNKFKDELINNKCLVKGVRKNRNIFDTIFSILMGLYSSILLKKWLFDINAQPKIFHRSYINKFINPPLDFSLDLFIMIFFKSNKIKINSFPVFFKNRLHGESIGGGSMKGKSKLIIRTLKYVNNLVFRK